MAGRVAAIGLVIACTVGASRPASAQGAAADGLATVFVTTATDEDELKGRIIGMGPGGLRVLVREVTRDIPLDSILRVETRGDSIKEGALAGAIFGAIPFLLNGTGSGAWWMLWVGGWASAGAGLDAMIPGRKTIYRASDGQRSGGQRAVTMRLRF